MLYNQLQQVTQVFQTQIQELDVFDPSFVELSIGFVDENTKLLQNLNWEGVGNLEKHKIKHILFDWLEGLKQVAILIRDINLKSFRDLHFINEGILEYSVFQAEMKSSFTLLSQALDELKSHIESISEIQNIDQSLSDKWYHCNSPLEEYLKQLSLIHSQLEQIDKSKASLFNLAQDVKQNKGAIFYQIQYFKKSAENIINRAKEMLGMIEVCKNVIDFKEITTLANSLQKFYEELQEYKVSIVAQQANINTVGKIKIPAYIMGGQLSVKELNINDHINQWLEEEIFPTLLDINRFDELVYEKGIVSCLNTKNRVELLKIDHQEGQIVPKSMLSVPFRNFLREAESINEDIITHSTKIEQRINSEYLLSYLFSKDVLFLKDNVEFSLIDYRKNKGVFSKVNLDRFKKIWNDFAYKYLSEMGVHKEAKTDVINFINYNKLPELDQFSQSLFLKKGYIGNSFIMPRESFESMLIQNFEHWKQDFQGSLLVYGNRLSGRSAIVQSVEHILNEAEVINILPNTTIKYKGRKFETGFDLKASLDFIYKHAISNRIVVVIDDLELWRSKEIPFLKTAKNIVDAYTKYNRRIFLVIATNHHIKLNLDHFLDFSDYFLSKYNTDRMKKEEIIKSLLIRHSASMREMALDEETQALDEIALRRLAGGIAKKSHLNIGTSLKNWSRFVMHAKSENESIHKAPNMFVEFIKDHANILTHILRYKITNEQELRDMVGATYVRTVNEDVQLLLSFQILLRDRYGSITINEALIQFVEEIIKKEYLKPNKVAYV